MKYKELLESVHLNNFNINDQIYVYDREISYGYRVFTIKEIINEHIRIKEVNISIHYKQCRKLEEIKPKEFYIKEGHVNSHNTERNDDYFIGMRLSPKQGYIKVREVLED